MADQATVVKEIQARFTANIQDYRSKMRQLSDTVSGMTRSLEGVKRTAASAMASPSASTQKLGRELDATAQKLQAQKDRFDSLSRSGERTARQMEQLREKLGGMSNAYHAIQAAASTIDLSTPIRKQADAAKAAVEEIDVQIEKLSAGLKQAGQGKFVSLDNGTLLTIDQARAKIAELSQAGVEAAAKYEHLREAIRSIGEENLGYASAKGLEQLKTKIDSTTDRLSGLGNKLKDTNARAERLADGMRTTSSVMEQQAASLNKDTRMCDGLGNAFSRVGITARKGLSGIRERLAGIGNSARGSASNVSNLGSSLKKLGMVVGTALSVRAITNFGKACIELGSDLAEVENVVDVTFTSMSGQVDQFAKSAAKQFGLSETMAKRYTGTFGAMSKAFGFSEQQAYNMSTALTGLAGDVASFYNITQDEAYTKLKSVFTGETESLKDLGVVMTQTALDQFALANGFGKTTKEMSEQEKVALRYAFVQKQLATASGDFARTSDGWANQVRILKLQVDSLKASIGQGLINALTPAIKAVNTLIGRLVVLADQFRAFTEMLSGKKSSGGSGLGAAASAAAEVAQNTEAAADASDALTDSTEKAGAAAKKAAKELRNLMGFDEINKLSEKDDTTDTGSTDSATGTAGNVPAAVQDLGNALTGPAGGLASQLDDLAQKLANIWDVFRKAWDQEGAATLKAAQEMLKSLKTLAQDVGSTFYKVFTDGYGFDWAVSGLQLLQSMFKVVKAISDAFDKAWNDNGNGYNYVASIFRMFTKVNNLLRDINLSFVEAWNDNGLGVSIATHLIHIFTNVNDIIGNLAGSIDRAWKKSENGTRIWSGVLKLVDRVLESVDKVTGATAKWADNVDFSPMLKSFGDLLDALNPLADLILGDLEKGYEDILLPLASWTIEDAAPKSIELVAKSAELLTTTLTLLDDIYQKLREHGLDLKDLHTAKLEHLSGLLKNVAEAIELVNKALKSLDDLLNGGSFKPGAAFKWIGEFQTTIMNLADNLLKLTNPGAAIGEWIGNAIGKKLREKLAGGINLGEIALTIMAGVNPFVGVGMWIVKGFQKGVGDTIADIGNWLKEHLVDPVVNRVRGLFGVHSPSTVFARIGSDLIHGLLKGISDTWNSVGLFFTENLGGLKIQISNAWSAVKTNTSAAWEEIQTQLSAAWSGIQTNAGSVWQGLNNTVSSKWSDIKSGTSTVWSGIKTQLSATWSGLQSKANSVWQSMKTTVSSRWSDIRSNTSTAWSGIKSRLGTIWSGLQSNADSAWKRITASVENGWKDVKTNTSATWDGVKTSLGGIWSGLKTTADSTWRRITSSVASNWSSVKANTSTSWNSIKSTVTGVWNSMKSAASSIMSGLESHFSSGWNAIQRETTPAVSRLKKAFLDGMDGLKSGVQAVMDGVKTTVRNAVDDLKNIFSFHWNLPYIPTPHFNWDWLNLGMISIPTNFRVNWYAKGGILDGAQLFGAMGNTLLGGGEAGREAVLPLERNTEWMDRIADKVAERMYAAPEMMYSVDSASGRDQSDLSELLILLREVRTDLAALRRDSDHGNTQPLMVQCVLDGKVIATSTVDYINRRAMATGVNPLSAYI